nr:DUF5076 domain-containing protein [Candidatus Viadribacter manganicus]
MKKLEELPIPQVAIDAKQKAELIRIWLADGGQVVSLSDRMWSDPGM